MVTFKKGFSFLFVTMDEYLILEYRVEELRFRESPLLELDYELFLDEIQKCLSSCEAIGVYANQSRKEMGHVHQADGEVCLEKPVWTRSDSSVSVHYKLGGGYGEIDDRRKSLESILEPHKLMDSDGVNGLRLSFNRLEVLDELAYLENFGLFDKK